MTHKEFVNISRQFVKYYPYSTDTCKQLQTFALLDHPDQVLDSNLGQNINDKDSNYFCRTWAQTGHNESDIIVRYPIMVMRLESTTVDNILQKTNGFIQHRYAITIIDSHKNQKPDKGANVCDTQHIPDILDQCSRFFAHYFDYLKGVVYATENTGSEYWAHKGLFEYRLSEGLITNYVIDNSKTDQFKKRLKDLNSKNFINLRYWNAGENYGVEGSIFLRIDLPEFCNGIQSFDFSQQYDKQVSSFGNENIKLI